MGRVVDGRWMSEDEILDRDPVAGPLGRRFEEAMTRLRDDMESGYSANVGSFRDRLRERLMDEANRLLTIVWELTGDGICQLGDACTEPARWVVQTGTGERSQHYVACERHRP